MSWLDFCKTKIDDLKRIYRQRLGKNLNLEDPKTFTEKQQWLKIYDSTFLKTFCTDKITVHEYVKEKLGKDICIPIITTYNKPDEIKFSALPNSFVIKCNHGCEMNIIVKDKKNLNIYDTKQKLTKWLNEDYSEHNAYELHYKCIPHKILIEEFKENQGHNDLTDYKFYCINGKPIFCQIITDRHTNEKMSHYDMNWKYSPEYDWKIFKSISDLKKPKHFDEMKEYAIKLSKEFKLVRIDFYEIENKVYLGEMTFTPYSGCQPFKNPNTDIRLGNLLTL